ncbi:DUF3822 family protein [Pedobacter yulinensis]|nr:DUF3822 family protein [Pedobacter yulinensis]
MNSNNSIFLSTPDFQGRREAADELLVRITEHSFSYAVIGEGGELLKALFDRPECSDGAADALSALANDPVFALPFARVVVAAQTDNIIFVPPALLADDPTAYAKYFRFTDGEALHSHHEDVFNTVFTVPAKVERFVNQLEAAELLPLASPALKMTRHLQHHALLLDFTPRHVSFLYHKDGLPVFFQTYEVEGPEELNYYLLLLIDSLDLAPETVVYLCGIVHEDDAAWSCVGKYFVNRHFFLPEQSGIDLDLLNELPAQYYSTLLAQRLCGS